MTPTLKSLRSTVRDNINEPSTVYLPDSSLTRMVNSAQTETFLALKHFTGVTIDTFITSVNTVRYYLKNVATTRSDSVQSGSVAAVIYKDVNAAGGNEKALEYTVPELIGKYQTGTIPSHYTVLGRHLVLGKSPLGGDTLFVYMNRVPLTMSSDGDSLNVAQEDKEAVAWYAAALALAADKQYQGAAFYFQLWDRHVNNKKVLPEPKKEQ